MVDRSSVQKEPAVCSSAVLPALCSSAALPAVRLPVVRSVVVSLSGPDIVLIVASTRGPVSCLSTPVEISHPNVDLAINSVPGDGQLDVDQFDDTLIRFYGYLNQGRQLCPPHTPLYNMYVGGKLRNDLDCLTFGLIHLRNIRVGKPLVVEGLHVGGVSRYASRTFVQNIGGRKTDTNNSFVRVKGGHHEGRNYFASDCQLNPPLPGYCRIVYIDTKKVHWCSIDSVAFHSLAWPQNVGKAKSI